MPRIPDAFIDELLSRTDIVELIESRVPLKRAGREYQARCPFHDERSPSFTVSPTKQFYHCFGCGAHGTAIKFLMEYDRMEFLDAVEELAQRAGVQIPRDARPSGPSPESEGWYAALEAAAKFYQRQLGASDLARAYLERRGLDRAVIERYGIGYAPDGWDGLKSALGGDERKLKILDKVGLLSTGDRGNSYDKFRKRIMFPIRDRRGRTIAFGGRVIDKDDTPKYLNSPETPLFHKGRELYGLWEARQANAKLARLLVVEGYMDVVSLNQYGVTQCVATLGTATTKEHAELLFRNSADVFFCFDGDRAGRAAAWRAAESVLPRMREGRQAFFLFLPEGEDPDTLVRKEGLAGFEQRLGAATGLSEFVFAELGHEVNLATLEGKARLAERARPLLAQIPDGAFRDLIYQALAERTGVRLGPAAVAATAPAAITSTRSQTREPARSAHGGARRSLVRTAIALLVQQPALVKSIEPPYLFAVLRQPGIPLLMELIELCRARPEISTGAVLEHFAEREEQAALNKLSLMEFAPEPNAWQAEFRDALEQLNRQTLQQRIDELLAKQTQTPLSESEKNELRDALAAKARR
jgi:DNA primase